MQDYNSVIKKCIVNKYQDSTIFDKKFINLFFEHRKNIVKKLNLIKKNNRSKFSKDDETFNRFFYFYKNNKKKIDYYIVNYYKKFESNLSLKKKYKKNFKKNSNEETRSLSYIYLGYLINKNKYLNSLKKLNCIIKIIDKISFNFSNLDSEGIMLLEKLILIERFLFKRII